MKTQINNYKEFNIKYPKGKSNPDGENEILVSQKGLSDLCQLESINTDEYNIIENINILINKGYKITNK
tara:strand:- start:283 stop:489 length:207 start_codon:yes stop_codon:yes gene_type:complete